MSTQSFPLLWPPAWPRTKYPQHARFDTPQGAAQSGILRELSLLGATNVVISTNIELRRDGLPYAKQLRADEDRGVAVYFSLDGQQQCIPCDKWSTIADNMQAIRKTIEALRGLDRWGAKEMVNAAFRGFKALPESGTIVTPYTPRPWHEVLQVAPNADWDVIEAAYKRLLHKVHPDKGGSEAEFMDLQEAFKQAKAANHD